MHRPLGALMAAVILALVGCQPAGSPGASPSSAATPASGSAPAEPASPAASAVASGAPTAEPAPSDQAGDFSCDFPVIMQATATATTNILDVRVGTHDGYDRAVFEFNLGTPEFSLERAEPPFSMDPSGLPLDVAGSSFLRLIMRGGTKMTESGASSYSGPTNFDPGFPQLVDLVEGGDFEAQSTWYLGLNAEACGRVFLLTDPDRLVIDLEH